MQNSLAIIVSIALEILKYWPSRKIGSQNEHSHALLVATVEFQKSQCYFAGAIQIGTLVFSARQIANFLLGFVPDLIDESFLDLLSTQSLVPTVFTLANFARHGRQSWYLISLSVVIFVLSTASLACGLVFYLRFNRSVFEDIILNLAFLDSSSCGQTFTDIAPLFCGPDHGLSNMRFFPTVSTITIGLLWLNCLIWLLFCVIKQLLTTSTTKPSILKHQITWLKTFPKSASFWDHFWSTLFVISWLLSFGCQFYVYSLSFRSSTINNKWSFGQIISITVWAPCLAEYLNLATSECLSPTPSFTLIK